MSKRTITLPLPSPAAAVAALAVAASLYAVHTRAQQPGNPPPPGFVFQGGRGGFGGNIGMGGMNIVMGQITDGDPKQGIIVVKGGFNGETTIHTDPKTAFVNQKQVDVSALQVGDQVQVQGMPTAITANSISAGQLPDAFRPDGGGTKQGQREGNQGVVLLRGDQNGPQSPSQNAFANATGKITGLSPLTISLGGEATLTLKVAPNARITKIQKITINELKNGDNIMATGQPGNDGTLNATGVGVNVTNLGGLFGGGMNIFPGGAFPPNFNFGQPNGRPRRP